MAKTPSISPLQTSIWSTPRMLLRPNRSSDSNQVCLWKDWIIHDVCSWVLCVAKQWWRTTLYSSCYRCTLDTIRSPSSSMQWITRWWKCFPSSMMIKEEFVKFDVQGKWAILWSWKWWHNNGWFWLDSMVSNYRLHPSISSVWNVRWMDLCVHRMTHPCLMWWTINVLEVMRISIRPISIWLVIEYARLPIHQYTTRNIHNDE